MVRSWTKSADTTLRTGRASRHPIKWRLKMLKRLGLPVVALAGLLTLFTPLTASARPHVRFGFSVGVPAYTYPYTYADPYYDAPYVDPYAPGYYDYAPYSYVAP